jgi:hypothetical protein
MAGDFGPTHANLDARGESAEYRITFAGPRQPYRQGAQAGAAQMKTQNTLADLRPEVLHFDVACSRCDRGRLSVARLVEQQGAGATLRVAVTGINANCPNREAHGVMQQCDIYFPGLGGLLR